ncbi:MULTISPECIES: bifunctional DNA primase/polymerase [unclassified Microbacterium]|uniref:bifunctional DNA primase/polymerase n=1 Tax=unclassified Microbacterium TaxID=2609290 RepID=UPI000EAAA935|nr:MULTISPECIES: bifunctional DNA primase/polymerase [unclassified Microbacterium]MBT2483113.1 bifunctional DNA primase/polymerase [Microbacterium sp. ISL-108]RKN66173.1 DNA primase [Microbacterium sp. CGR2]
MMASPDALASVLTRINEAWPLTAAARVFAAAGVPVFPCMPGGKRPLTAHGFYDATTDPGQLAEWWNKRPGANIGVPTGAASGVVVVDVDVHGPVNGFEAFDHADRAGLVDGWQFLVSSPSGGMHAYYPAAPGQAQRSWQAARVGIDFRGDGGYIVVPPSQVTAGGTSNGYRVRHINPGAAHTLDSDGLRDFLDPRPAPRRPVGGVTREADVSRLAAWVANRGEGERNRGLFWAACRLAENNVPATDALDALTAAARHAGLSQREVTTTVRSAYRTIHPLPSTRDSSVQGRADSPLAADEWFGRDAATGAEPWVPGL